MHAEEQNAERVRWSRSYRTALRRYLQPQSTATLLPAQRLGHRAATLGLETLDVARIHERVLAALPSPDGSSGTARETIGRARRFYAEVLVPIEQTHPPALRAAARVAELTESLHRLTRESSAATRHLKRGVAGRQAAEAAAKKGAQRQDALLADAQCLQKRLRRLMREILLEQEDRRNKTGRHLRDEIGQTLLAIQIRLLGLKRATKANTETLRKEIAETRRMVEKSAKALYRLADAFEGDHEP